MGGVSANAAIGAWLCGLLDAEDGKLCFGHLRPAADFVLANSDIALACGLGGRHQDVSDTTVMKRKSNWLRAPLCVRAIPTSRNQVRRSASFDGAPRPPCAQWIGICAIVFRRGRHRESGRCPNVTWATSFGLTNFPKCGAT